MHRRLNEAALGTLLLTLLACTGGGDSKVPTIVTGGGSTPSTVAPVFDPANAKIPLPNILATATATDPLIARLLNKPMTPPEALAYVNLHEMGGTNAVAGTNAPIYIQFTGPVDAATVTAANIKVFQLAPDAAGTENAALGFTDISATFSYRYAAGGTDLLMFPNFPMLPGTRYLYVVTNRVMDAGAPSKPVSTPPFFEALKSVTPLGGAFAALEPIRANVTAGANILLSGYGKVMNDLITASATTTITQRADIALMGRFITTAAGAISLTTTSPSATGASLLPVESALRAFAFGSSNGLGGLLAGKTWTNTIAVPANTATSISTFVAGTAASPDLYWGAVLTAGGQTVTPAPATVGTVVLGSFSSADLSIDPVATLNSTNSVTMNLTGIAGVNNPAAGVTQAFRVANNLMGFYHTDRTVPFVYIAPNPAVVGAAPAGGWPVVIYQHGITSQKETVIAVAQSFTAVGRAVIAIDLPLHGALAAAGHTSEASWGQDFMAVGAPLATRTNVQQGAFNLNRLEFTLRAGSFAAVGAAAPSQAKVSFLGHSLGSIVGAYYLAGNATLAHTGLPYTQATLDLDMKGYLAVPGARTAYLIQNSPSFNGPNADPAKAFPIDQALALAGVPTGSPTYHQFFQVTQSVVDPVDPATITTPLYGVATGAPVDGPSRLSGRVVIQESTTSTYSATVVGKDLLPMPTNGDLVIGNAYTRYFAAALGGRDLLSAAGAKVAPNFSQLAYTAGGTPPHAAGIVGSAFLKTIKLGAVVDKVVNAAVQAIDPTPTEGFFQFDQTGIGHSSLLDPTASPANTGLIQKQMRYFLGITGTVVDPTQGAAALPIAPGLVKDVQVPEAFTILGY